MFYRQVCFLKHSPAVLHSLTAQCYLCKRYYFIGFFNALSDYLSSALRLKIRETWKFGLDSLAAKAEDSNLISKATKIVRDKLGLKSPTTSRKDILNLVEVATEIASNLDFDDAVTLERFLPSADEFEKARNICEADFVTTSFNEGLFGGANEIPKPTNSNNESVIEEDLKLAIYTGKLLQNLLFITEVSQPVEGKVEDTFLIDFSSYVIVWMSYSS